MSRLRGTCVEVVIVFGYHVDVMEHDACVVAPGDRFRESNVHHASLVEHVWIGLRCNGWGLVMGRSLVMKWAWLNKGGWLAYVVAPDA